MMSSLIRPFGLSSQGEVQMDLRDSVEEFEKITDNQETLYKDLGSKQIIKEEIDDAIDWVRDPYCD